MVNMEDSLFIANKILSTVGLGLTKSDDLFVLDENLIENEIISEKLSRDLY